MTNKSLLPDFIIKASKILLKEEYCPHHVGLKADREACVKHECDKCWKEAIKQLGERNDK